MSDSKPLFRVGTPVRVTRLGLPNAPSGTPAVITRVVKVGKRGGFAHRYEIKTPAGIALWVYEDDVSTEGGTK